MLVVVSVVLLVVLLIYFYLENKLKNLRRIVNVHTKKPLPVRSPFVTFYNALFERRKLGPSKAFAKMRNEYGSEYGGFFFAPIVTLTQPDHVKHVLKNIDSIVKSPPPSQIIKVTRGVFGEQSIAAVNQPDWHNHRSIMNKSFANNKVFFEAIENKINQCLNLWKSDNPVFIGLHIKKMTLDVLGVCIFGKDFDTLHGQTSGPLTAYTFIINELLTTKYLLFPYLLDLPLPESGKAKKMVKVFDDYCWEIINESKRELATLERPHLISLMLSNNLSDAVIRDNIGVFFLAGHETTATTLTWGLGLLATHQDVQTKMRNEVATITKNFTRKLEYDDLKDLTYIDCFIRETMRLYPAAPAIGGRRTTVDMTIGDWFIPANTELELDLISMLHDPSIWPDPSRFDPDRFLPDRLTKEQRNAWIPFSYGPRICIGMSFSLVEQKIFWASLVTVFSSVSMAPGSVLQYDQDTLIFGPKYSTLGLLFKERTCS